jgi:hypothetical protein
MKTMRIGSRYLHADTVTITTGIEVPFVWPEISFYFGSSSHPSTQPPVSVQGYIIIIIKS